MAATAALLLAALTACGGGDDSKAETKPSAVETSKAEEPSAGQVEKGMKLGTPARTTGDGGEGVLEITPDTVVFTKEGGGETAENGVFAVVTMKDKAMTAVAADEPAPISGGGWKWMAPDGEMINAGGGNAFNVVMDKYNNADPVQPGAWQWRSQVFDLTPEQAKGGTLIYIDGEEKAHRWEISSEDSGPNVAEVKKQLEF
ncbi:hypothetical protein ACF07S_10560 [Streptomyces sp. NPDC016640]|uniref:hypothetical protein n=1 Tax=Streptomyces sp. NPDC016640 TaxID=3364969 RepID=UPI0037007713